MEEQIEEELEEDWGEGDESMERLVRAVLLFCAIVVVGAAAYTTFVLFQSYEIDITFSPPENVQFSPEESSEGTASFNIEQSIEGEGGEKKVFKTQNIEPYSNKGWVPNPLIISEDLKGSRMALVLFVILLEIIIIGLIYWKLDKRIRRKR